MRYINSLVLALITLLSLVGCLASGGGASSGGGTDYDGTWKATFGDSSVTDPAPATGETMYCSQPPVDIVIVNGMGTTTQNRTCQAYTTGTATAVGLPHIVYYQIGVSIIPGDVFKATVNGVALTGKCISAVGCSAPSANGGLSINR